MNDEERKKKRVFNIWFHNNHAINKQIINKLNEVLKCKLKLFTLTRR